MVINEWIKESLYIATETNYLDKLMEIYPADPSPREPLDSQIKQKILELHRQQNGHELLKVLLNLKHPFPLEHPFASILRQLKDEEKIFQNNPKTIAKLAEILLKLDSHTIITGCERFVDINRQMGRSFQHWLEKTLAPEMGYKFLKPTELLRSDKGFLVGGDDKIKSFAKDKLNYDTKGGRDFLCKIGKFFIIGEARFFSTVGGSQNRDLEATINFAQRKRRDVIPVAVIDGIVWFYKKYVEKLVVLDPDYYVFSALLLKKFFLHIESLQ